MWHGCHDKLGNAGPYGAGRTDGSKAQRPARTADLSVEIAGFGTGSAQLYPLEPKVRITNNTGRTLGGA